jgi:hypothetical protein
MKFFEKIMIDEYNEFINEEYKKPNKLAPAQGGPSDQQFMARLYLPSIKKAKNKDDLDKIFKKFEYAVKSRNLDSDDIDLMKSWFEERSKELGIKESYEINENKKAQDYVKKIKNKNKKAYAEKYLKWKMSGEKGNSPDKGSLGVMGAQAVRMQLDDLFESINEAPIAAKGWDSSSVEKFGETIGKAPTEKGFFDACVKRMSNKEGFDEEKAKGFCASIKDKAYNSPNWRGKGKSEKEAKKDTQKDQYKK